MSPGEEAGILSWSGTVPMDQDKQFKEKEVERLVVESTSDSSDTEHATVLRVPDEVDAKSRLLPTGTLIAGHYEVLSVIGQGAMGTVYKVRHLLVDQVRAIKLLRTCSESQTLRRFQQEAKASLALRHDNIVRVYEFGIEQQLQQPYLVMEYVEGETLSDILAQSGRLDHDHVCAIAKQICKALSHAHACDIVHRDIKPANILISKGSAGEEIAKLADFGIARITTPEDGQDLTQTGEVFGTPLYMSPEQCLGQRVDARSDIYSLGCVIYECLTGKPPFQGASSLETIMMHASGSTPKFTADVPPSVTLVILKSLEKSLKRRYQGALELEEALLNTQVRNSNLSTYLRTEWAIMRRQPNELRKSLMFVCLMLPFLLIIFCLSLASDAQREKILSLKQQSMKAQLMAEKSNDPAAWIGIASELEQKGDLIDAERAFRKSIQLKSNNKQAWLGLATVLQKQGRTKEAEAAKKQASESQADGT